MDDAELSDRRWITLAASPILGALLLRLLDPERPDRLGHFLAGFGATLLACWVVALLARGRPIVVLAATFGCIGLGMLVERFVFPLGGYDALDVAAQSAGAIHAGVALLAGEAGDPESDWFDVERFRPSAFGATIACAAVVALVAGVGFAFS